MNKNRHIGSDFDDFLTEEGILEEVEAAARKRLTHAKDGYTYRLEWSEADGEHVGLCAEFPSLSWLAPTPEEAIAGIRKLVADVVKDMRDNNEPVPSPLSP